VLRPVLDKKQLAARSQSQDWDLFFKVQPARPTTRLENVELPRCTQLDREDHSSAPNQTLELVGLGQRMDHFPSQLSVDAAACGIARALVTVRRSCWPDEAHGHLDSRTSVEIIRSFRT